MSIILNSIHVKQENINKVYVFEREWMNDKLRGEHFLADIFNGMESPIRHTTYVELQDDVWVVASTENTPDVLFYLWKKGMNSSVASYIPANELLFLYQFYEKNGFVTMLEDIRAASNTSQRYCVLL